MNKLSYQVVFIILVVVSGINIIFYMFLFPIFIALPAIILYFVIKLALKNAIKELKDENVL